MSTSVVPSRQLALQAMLAILPLSISVVPWGVLTGALAIEAGFSPYKAQFLSMAVFAGAAQLSAISMTAAGASPGSIFGSTVIISARHLLYSLVFKSYVKNLGLSKRMLIAFVLTDEMFVVSEAHTKSTGKFSYLYALVSGFTFYAVWNLSTLCGILLGQKLANLNELGLDFAIVATFIAMSIEQIRSQPEIVTVLVSGALAVFLKPVFNEAYLIIATLLGMASGYACYEFKNRRFA